MNSFLKKNKFLLFTINIIIMYIVGLVGILTSKDEMSHLFFLSLTPLNLVINILMLLSFHKKWNLIFVLSSIFIALSGFFIEVIGVKTGAIFGNYFYGNSLGFKIFEVPIMMALNWFLLIYCTTAILNKVNNIFAFAFIGASIITLLDTLIEPLCSHLNLWFWYGSVPFQNFVAWFIISFLLFFIYRKWNGNISNRYAFVVLALQFLFFGVLNLFRIYQPTFIY